MNIQAVSNQVTRFGVCFNAHSTCSAGYKVEPRSLTIGTSRFLSLRLCCTVLVLSWALSRFLRTLEQKQQIAMFPRRHRTEEPISSEVPCSSGRHAKQNDRVSWISAFEEAEPSRQLTTLERLSYTLQRLSAVAATATATATAITAGSCSTRTGTNTGTGIGTSTSTFTSTSTRN